MATQIFIDIFFSFFVAIGFALLFETPLKALIVAGVLGGLGHGIRYLMLQSGFDLVLSTLCGTVFIGLAGIFFAHKIHTPPVVFTLPACITMIPGLFAYRTILGCIKIYEAGTNGDASNHLQETMYNFIVTSSLLFCLAIGISIAALAFRKKSIKEIRRIKDL
ncbi:MAG: threonine/serine exporter [Bacteroidetes bacterium]|nr:threonine/serine exporter [Bacteroidota bacterium]